MSWLHLYIKTSLRFVKCSESYWYCVAGEREFTKSAHYITPVKKNVFGPSEAYTEEEYTCKQRGETGFVVNVSAYNRKVRPLT